MPTLRKIQVSRPRPVRPIAASLATLAALATLGTGSAWAEEASPWYIGASQSLTHDSNVFRIANGPAGNYSSTGLLGGFDQTFGRQRLFASANVRYNKYQDRDEGTLQAQSKLNNTSYALNAGWDWATLEKLSGNVNVSANRSLAAFNGISVQPTTERNLLSAEQFNTSVRWGGDGLISVFGNYGHSRVSYSALQSLTSESTGDTGSVGMNHRLGASTTVGAAVRLTRTSYPYAIAPVVTMLTPINRADYRSDSVDGRNLDLLADWRYSAQTGVNLRLSWTRLTYASSNRDFSGLTGAVSATYAPTAKLGFSASLSRDAGTNSTSATFVNLANGQRTTYLTENSQTSDSLSLGASYAATAKISVVSGLNYRRANYANNSASDHYRSATLGVTYAVARNWQLACNLSHEALSSVVNSYDANVLGCSAQFTLR